MKTNCLSSFLLVGSLTVSLLSVLGCGDELTMHQSYPSEGSGGGIVNEPPGTQYLPWEFETSEKVIGDASSEVSLEWDLGNEYVRGKAAPGATFKIKIIKYIPADGSADTYMITEPELTAGAEALAVSGIYIRVNGVLNEVSTTFSGVDEVVAAGGSVILSGATLLHQTEAGASPSDSIGLAFQVLWPDSEPMVIEEPIEVVLDGKELYKNHCANCHGALQSSTKKNRSFSQILNSISNVSKMNYLANQLSDDDIKAIADALK